MNFEQAMKLLEDVTGELPLKRRENKMVEEALIIVQKELKAARDEIAILKAGVAKAK